MKKTVFIMLVISLLAPASIFALTPAETEVAETTAAVLSSFGIVFLSSMFGEIPEGVDVDMDMTTGNSVMKFENFNPVEYMTVIAEQNQTTLEAMDSEMPEFYFDEMSGSIAIDENGNMNLDMSLKGGNIRTIKLQTSDEDLVYFTANGKDYSYLDYEMLE